MLNLIPVIIGQLSDSIAQKKDRLILEALHANMPAGSFTVLELERIALVNERLECEGEVMRWRCDGARLVGASVLLVAPL